MCDCPTCDGAFNPEQICLNQRYVEAETTPKVRVDVKSCALYPSFESDSFCTSIWNSNPESSSALERLRREFEISATRIQSLHHTLRLAKQERDLLGLQLWMSARFLTPIKKVPGDILEQIFLYCLDDGDPDPSLHCYSLSDRSCEARVPWILGQVCSGWRAIVESSSRLWSSMSFEEYDLRSSNEEDDVNFYLSSPIQQAFAYAKSSPLTIRLQAYSTPCPAVAGVLDLFLQRIAQWKDIELDCPSRLASRALHLPALETLRLTTEATMGPISTTFFMAPSLRNLYLECLESYERTSLLAVPWHQITSLCMKITANDYGVRDQLDLVAIANILQKSSSLKTLTLVDADNVYSHPEIDLEIKHTTLTSLHVTGAWLLRFFNAPALQKLVLDILVDHDVECLRRLIRSHPSLTSLSIYQGVDLGSRLLYDLLYQTPSLRHLDISTRGSVSFFDMLFRGLRRGIPSHSIFYDELREQLAGEQSLPPAGDGDPLPALESLLIRFDPNLYLRGDCTVISFLSPDFIDTIKSRLDSPVGSSLRTLHIYFSGIVHFPHLDQDMFEDFFDWHSKGLNFRIFTSKGSTYGDYYLPVCDLINLRQDMEVLAYESAQSD